MGLKSTYCFILLSFCLMSYFTKGQQLDKLVKITGDMGIYGDFYHMESYIPDAVKARRPGTLYRFVSNASINMKGISCPISMSLPSMQNAGIFQNVPAIPDAPWASIKQLIKNPLNHIGIAPKYKWAQVLLGSQTPNYSELSMGYLAVFGTGINLTPGKFRFSCFAGTSQLAIEENKLNNIQGIYARKIYSAKIGIGHQDSSHVYIIESMTKDDTSSLRTKPASVMPQAGVLTTLDFRINLSNRIYIKGEVAGSAFTRDVRSSDEVTSKTNTSILDIFSRKTSTRLDYASVLSIGKDGKNYGIKATARYYGDGFVPMGYQFMQTDRLDLTIDPRFNLFKNKLQICGSVGRRVNNLSGTKAATTTQSIGSLNVNTQLSEKLSVAASFSNFGFRNSVLNDTFKLEMVTLSWSISPSYNFLYKKKQHNFTIIYSQNIFKDFNTITGTLNNNDANNGVISYMLSNIKNPFTFNAMLSYFDNNCSFGRLLTKAVKVNFGYKFLKKKLNTTAGLMLANNTINTNTSGFQTMILFGAKYLLNTKLNFSINASFNIFKYGESNPQLSSYRENFLRTSIIYKF